MGKGKGRWAGKIEQERLEKIKKQYQPTAPNLPLELVAEIEQLRAEVERLKSGSHRIFDFLSRVELSTLNEIKVMSMLAELLNPFPASRSHVSQEPK